MNDVRQTFMENRAIFLNSLSHLLPENPATNVLRSYYLTKCRGIMSLSTVDLPREIIKESCPNCCVQYKDAQVSHKIVAAKRRNRFQRRLLQNTENINTKFQKVYLDSLQKKGVTNDHNFLTRTCGVCKHVTKKVLQKPATKSPKDELEISAALNKPKKRKKKDRFSGLNMNAVLSVTPQKAVKETPKKTPTQSAPKKSLNKSQIRQNKIDNKKKLKGLKNIFNDTTRSTPVNSLKNFLNSL